MGTHYYDGSDWDVDGVLKGRRRSTGGYRFEYLDSGDDDNG